MPYFYDWYEYASSCGNTSGFSCGYADISFLNCSAGGQCAKAVIEVCENIDTSKCEDNDGDGFYGLDPECINGLDCDDTPGSGHIIRPGQPENCSTTYDDNCDIIINCEDPSCHEDTSCDKDGDGYYSMDCGGPIARTIPSRNRTPRTRNQLLLYSTYLDHPPENDDELLDLDEFLQSIS